MIGASIASPVTISLLADVAAMFLVLIMARALFHKLRDPAFVGTLADYRILPEILVQPFVWILAMAETLAVICLISPGTRYYGAVISAGLLVLYGGAIAINLLRGRFEIDCGCGGDGDIISWALVARNAVLAMLAVAVSVLAVSDLFSPSLPWLAMPVAILCAGLLMLALVLFEDIATRNALIALRITRRQ